MKRAATHLLKRQSKNRAFFSKLSNFYFDLRPLPGQIFGQDRGAKSRPQGQLECCGSPGVFWWGGGGGWSGLELTDTVLMHYASLLFTSVHIAHRRYKIVVLLK